MLLTDLPVTLRSGGCRVEVDPGYASRGQGALAGVKAIMCHHTGSVSANTWKVVRDGREGLRGLLSQLVLERDGLWRVLGSGQAWHAGSGGPLIGIPVNAGNSWTVGVEAVSAGTAKGDWTAAQLTEYPRGVAALCRRYGLTEQQVIFHKTWAPSRKIDLAGWPGDLPGFRAAVARHLSATSTSEEDDMTPEQDQMLRLVFQQLAGGGSTPAKFLGWETWGGGTAERLTAIDLLRRSNVETRVGRNESAASVAALRAEVNALSKQVGELVAAVRAGAGGGGSVSGDVQAIAAAVLSELSNAYLTITATTTPKEIR